MEQELEELGRLYDLFMVSMKAVESRALITSVGGRGDSFWDLVFEVRRNREKLTDEQIVLVLKKARNITASVMFIHGSLLLARFKGLTLYWKQKQAPIVEALPKYYDYCHLFAQVQSIVRARQERRSDDQNFLEQMRPHLANCHRALLDFQYARHDMDSRARRWRRDRWAAFATVFATIVAVAGLAVALFITDADRQNVWALVKCWAAIQGAPCK